MNKHIKRGRISIFVISVMFVIAILITGLLILTTAEEKHADMINKRVSLVFALLFCFEFIGITALVIVLAVHLTEKKNLIHRSRSNTSFRRGILILVTIVLIFGLSFLVRVANDAYLINSSKREGNAFRGMIYD